MWDVGSPEWFPNRDLQVLYKSECWGGAVVHWSPSLSLLSEDWGSYPSTHTGGLTNPCTSSSEDLMPFSGLCRFLHTCAHTQRHIYLYTYMNKKYNKSLKIWGRWDGPVGKGTCCQAWWPRFRPWDPGNRGRKTFPTSFLNYTHTQKHTHTYMHTLIHRHTHSHTHSHIHIHTHRQTSTYIHTLTHKHTLTYIHGTHTLLHTQHTKV